MINVIFESDDVVKFLKSRKLLKQYGKVKDFILNPNLQKKFLKKRKPKKDGIYQFRINKQYRAFCIFDGKDLIVFEISDHQI